MKKILLLLAVIIYTGSVMAQMPGGMPGGGPPGGRPGGGPPGGGPPGGGPMGRSRPGAMPLGPQALPPPFLDQLSFTIPKDKEAAYKILHKKYGMTSKNNTLSVTVSGSTTFDINLK